MKRLFIKITCAALAVLSAVSLTACSGDSSSKKESSTASAQTQTTVSQTTVPQTTSAKDLKKETDLKKLHVPDTTKDQFAGYWKITEGSGSQLKSFTFCFYGNQKSYMLIGTMGYFGTYKLEEKDGKPIFSSKLPFGLDGDYTYEFNKERTSVVLTNISDKSKSTMERQENFNSIPKPDENPTVDEAIIGAWKDDTGAYLYFGSDGIMYTNQVGVNFSFYNYSAKDGKITQTYTMKEKTTEEATYSFDGEKFLYNNYEYQRISADELV